MRTASFLSQGIKNLLIMKNSLIMTAEGLLAITLKDYLPVNKKDLHVMDAMCGFWSYSLVLKEHFGENINELVGVDKDDYFGNKMPLLFKKPLLYITSRLEDLGREFNDRFDLITNFRPQCYTEEMMLELIPAYERIREMLKNKGVLFATTYKEKEKDSLVIILKKTGFKVKEVIKNKHDKSQSNHGWIITAKPSSSA